MTIVTTNIHHDWPRYWLPVTEVLNLDSDGFLPDPDDEFGRHYNPGLRRLDSLREAPLLVLLGEPGSGKSSILEEEVSQLRAAGKRVHHLRLEQCTPSDVVYSTFEAPEVKDWLSGTETLFLILDSLDECRQRLDNVFRVLLGQLERLPRQRLRLRLACRSADWPWGFEGELGRLWAPIKASQQPDPSKTGNHAKSAQHLDAATTVYELVLLRRKDVEQAARDYRIDPTPFLTQVRDRDIVPFAALPNTLRMLLDIHRATRTLPDAKETLFRQGCALLAEEQSRSRNQARLAGTLSISQRLAVAGRIAAMMLLGGRGALWLGKALAISEDDLSTAEVYGDGERADGITFSVTRSTLDEVLNTALFTAYGSERLGFGHQSWAEYLAAAYLAKRIKDGERLLRLLRWAEDRRIPAKLSELAVWLANLSLPVFDALTTYEPALLLRCDLALRDAGRKEKLVAAILSAVQGDEPDLWRGEARANFGKLAYAGLSEQLRPWIADRSCSESVRVVALKIALACKLYPLAELAAHLALAADETADIRSAAARLVVEHGDAEQLARLRPLAIGNSASEALQSILLTRLWPEFITTRELFDACSANDFSCLGKYRHLPEELVERFSPADLVAALQWQENVPLSQGDFDAYRLANAIAACAWQRLDDPGVLPALARVVWRYNKQCLRVFNALGKHPDDPHPFAADARKRRLLVQAMFPLSDDPHHHAVELVFAYEPLLFVEDLPWLVERYETAQDQQQLLAQCIRWLFTPTAPGHWTDHLVEAACRDAANPLSPLADIVGSLMEPLYFGSDTEQAARKAYQSRQNSVTARRQAIDPPPAVRVANDLRDHLAGQAQVWLRLWQNLGLADNATEFQCFWESPIQKTPGWQRADASERGAISACATGWLMEVSASELGRPSLDEPATVSQVGLWLALDLAARERIDELQKAPDERWRVWLPALVFFAFVRDEASRAALLRMGFQRLPEFLLAQIDRKLAQEVAAGRSYFSAHDHLKAIWSSAAAELVHRHLSSLSDPAQRMGFLKLLLDQQDPDAVTLSLAEFKRCADSPLDKERQNSFAVAHLLMEKASSDAWPALWARTRSDGAYGEALWTYLANRWGWHFDWLPALGEADLSELYAWLQERFPAANDPVHPSLVVYSPAARDHLASLREACIGRLLALATLSAVEAIESLAERFPDAANWRERLHRARAARRDKEWLPIAPSSLINFIENSNKRFVRDAAELSDAVIASLNAYPYAQLI